MMCRDYWSELPRDVAVKILDMIPLGKELISLKLICKEWNFLISRICIPKLSPPNPCAPCLGFITHMDRVVPGQRDKFYELGFMFVSEYMKQDIVQPCLPVPILDNIWSLLPKEERGAAVILDCCNGMVLLESNSQLYVGNPLTKESFCIPINPARSTVAIRSSLVFDPSKFLCQDRDPFFNIASFARPPQEASVSHPMELDIYSSDTGGWCTYAVELEPHHLYGYDWIHRPVYFKGALYSLSMAMYLVCIDNVVPAPKRAWAIALPDKDGDEVFPDSTYCGCIGYSCERFLYSNRDEKHSRILVWMLENSSQWVLMHSISIRQDIGHTISLLSDAKMEFYKFSTSFRTRVFHPNDSEGTARFYMGSPDIFLDYDTVIKETLVHFVCPDAKIRVAENWIFPFSPCLLLLKSTT